MLESGDDYYGEHLSAYLTGTADGDTNAKAEEKLGLDIYNNLVKDKKGDTGCKALRAWLMAYAADTNEWETHDVVDHNKSKSNPEFTFDDKITADTVQRAALNAKNKQYRAGIKKIAGSPDVPCNNLWHLLLCPVSGLRSLSPYEFAFKANNAWTSEGGILKNTATAAYNKAKCGNSSVQCHKDVDPSKLTDLFQEAKGRMMPAKNDKKVYSGDALWKFHYVNDAGLYEGKFKTPGLPGFWGQTEQVVFMTQAECDEEFDTLCKDNQISNPPTEADRTRELDCEEKKEWCALALEKKPHGTPTSPHVAANASSGAPYTKVVQKFENCGVPWVGGVSGSALEQFAYAIWKNIPIDDVFLLQWMSLYVLSGFHSIGEVWAALQPMFAEFEELKKLAIWKVPVPIILKDGSCAKANQEADFLKALNDVYTKVKR